MLRILESVEIPQNGAPRVGRRQSLRHDESGLDHHDGMNITTHRTRMDVLNTREKDGAKECSVIRAGADGIAGHCEDVCAAVRDERGKTTMKELSAWLVDLEKVADPGLAFMRKKVTFTPIDFWALTAFKRRTRLDAVADLRELYSANDVKDLKQDDLDAECLRLQKHTMKDDDVPY